MPYCVPLQSYLPSLTPHKDSMSQCLWTHQSRTYHLRDASSRERIVQGTHRSRDASSKASTKGRIFHGTHRTRYAPSKGRNAHGMQCPWDAMPMGRNIRDFSFGDALVRNEITLQRISYSVSAKHQ
jgi:hypothetical protein